MVAIRVLAEVGEDRHLSIDLPQEIPTGPVEIIVRPVSDTPLETTRLASARAKLVAAGAMRPNLEIPLEAVPLSLEDRLRLGKLPPGARPSHELIDEDRGER